jgi:hypothetical protein
MSSRRSRVRQLEIEVTVLQNLYERVGKADRYFNDSTKLAMRTFLLIELSRVRSELLDLKFKIVEQIVERRAKIKTVAREAKC